MSEVYKLRVPIEYDGETITEISLDLEGLTVGQLERAEKRARRMLDKKENMWMPESNKKYLSCVAALAAGVDLELIRALRGSDFTQVCVLVQNFLLDGDSDSEEDWSKEESPDSSSTLNIAKKRTNSPSTESLTDTTS